jgi:uncharacterized protein YuzE
MKVIYNPTTDVLQIVLRDAVVEDFNEEQPNLKIDYDVDDRLVAIEIQNASELVDNPQLVEHEIIH